MQKKTRLSRSGFLYNCMSIRIISQITRFTFSGALSTGTLACCFESRLHMKRNPFYDVSLINIVQ